MASSEELGRKISGEISLERITHEMVGWNLVGETGMADRHSFRRDLSGVLAICSDR